MPDGLSDRVVLGANNARRNYLGLFREEEEKVHLLFIITYLNQHLQFLVLYTGNDSFIPDIFHENLKVSI